MPRLVLYYFHKQKQEVCIKNLNPEEEACYKAGIVVCRYMCKVRWCLLPGLTAAAPVTGHSWWQSGGQLRPHFMNKWEVH